MTTRIHIGLIIGLLAAIAAPPVASAQAPVEGCQTTPAVTACVYDDVYQSGCFTFALTYVDVWTPATDVYVNGYHGDACGTTFTGVAVGGSVGPLYGGVVWYGVGPDGSIACDTFVYYLTPPTGSQSVPVGCPAGGPPNPGWGQILP